MLERSLRAVAPQAHGRLLDVGCGDKPYEAWFRPFVSAYIGVEHGATFAAHRGGGAGGPDVVYGGGTLPFRDGSFDTVLSVQVLEHTPRPAALMAEMSRVLAPDGILILTAPFQFRLHEQPHDYFRYSPHGLRQLCADAGLEVFETIRPGKPVDGRRPQAEQLPRAARGARRPARAALGKLGHEAHQSEGRALVDAARRRPEHRVNRGRRARARPLFPDPDESLGYLVLARHSPPASRCYLDPHPLPNPPPRTRTRTR